MSAASYRVKVPRAAPRAAENPLAAPRTQAEESPSSELPGTFITAMPALADRDMRELEVTAVNPPYSYARISYHEQKKEYLYEV
ncbi:MAG: hypothetical protein L3K05_06340, partial [Thermoplasmata archaeon]|nr:hypothetical protein [Thermoplasmata archaeon]